MEEEKDLEMITEEPDTGSAIDKFRSGEERDAAYAALEKEFTKKSQRVKELERENMSMKSSLADEGADGDVEEFLSQYPDAAGVGDEIATELEQHPEWEGKEALLQAYTNVLIKNHKTPQELMKDEEFVQMIVSDPDIQERIINGYFASVPDSVKLPHSGGIPASPKSVPKNIEEAGRLLEEILKTN